jgi:tetratricopeptide (TPR) repeat protein
MKKYLLAPVLLLVMGIAFAQVKPKPKEKEKPPTQKEMDDMMKEMQKAMEEISPEDKKMMDSMGIKMPSLKNVPKMSDKQLADAWEDENRIVPKKDVVRIAAIPKNITDGRMGAYITSVQNKAAALLKPEVKNMADKIYSYIKSKSKNSSEAGNMATGLWIAGKPEMAYYTLGIICANDPANTDNLSNYASMLSMLGAQQFAIPVLNNLNAKFPNNSTLLNNLGQAWFGLGEISNAEKYLDSAIRVYAYHPQANYTKSFIEESKGNTAAATEAVKRSIKKSYSMEKENRLQKLGYKLKDDDLNWDFPMPQDPLGLEKFKWPGYPKNVAESEVLENEWGAFKAACKNKLEELKIKEKKAEAVLIAFNEQLTKQLIQSGNKGLMVDPMPRFAPKAIVKLKYLVEGKDGSLEHNYKTKGEALANAYVQLSLFEKTFSNQLEIFKKKI